jgi:hypothetical protein
MNEEVSPDAVSEDIDWFPRDLTLAGPERHPVQMLQHQTLDGRPTVHDGETASVLGLAAAPIEGPTHFSQFDPLAYCLWGPRWFELGCLSAHFTQMVFEGDGVVAIARPFRPTAAEISAHKSDGSAVLAGSISVPEHPLRTQVQSRRDLAKGAQGLRILDQLKIGMTSAADDPVSIDHSSNNGPLYPFSLADKLSAITEPNPWYTAEGGKLSPWGRPILPTEMISVLAMKTPPELPVRQPSVGLFLDLEVQVHGNPLFVAAEYTVSHEVVGLGESRKTESYWTQSVLTDAVSGRLAATVLLHQGVFKASHPAYAERF